MSVSFRHVFAQGPVIAALGRAAASGLRGARHTQPAAVPGPWLEAELPPRPEALVRDYVRHVGGDPAWYRGLVPPHLFPQWSFPLAARALSALPYPLARVMNAGCRIERHGPLPSGEPLLVRARIEAIFDDGRRAVVTQRIATGTRSSPDAVLADLRAYVPLAKKEDGDASRTKARPTVPRDVHEIAFLRIGAGAGLDFAKLTGDFNPIHWLRPYARAAGFRGCILHGFATLARAIESLNRARFAGDPSRLAVVDARFTRPLGLPANVGVYVGDGGGLWVGDAPGGGAYLEAHYETETRR
jgi:hypothetical protein